MNQMNENSLSLLRKYLMETVVFALVFAVLGLYHRSVSFEKEVRDKILVQLIESTNTIKEANKTMQK